MREVHSRDTTKGYFRTVSFISGSYQSYWGEYSDVDDVKPQLGLTNVTACSINS